MAGRWGTEVELRRVRVLARGGSKYMGELKPASFSAAGTRPPPCT